MSGCGLRVLSRVQVVIDLAHSRQAMPVVAAYVTRKSKDGIAVEWCEFAPRAILDLLRAPVSPYLTRIRSGEITPA